MGNMTASFKASFAWSKPATSSHLTFGFSDKTAPARAPRSFFESASSSSSSLDGQPIHISQGRYAPLSSRLGFSVRAHCTSLLAAFLFVHFLLQILGAVHVFLYPRPHDLLVLLVLLPCERQTRSGTATRDSHFKASMNSSTASELVAKRPWAIEQTYRHSYTSCTPPVDFLPRQTRRPCARSRWRGLGNWGSPYCEGAAGQGGVTSSDTATSHRRIQGTGLTRRATRTHRREGKVWRREMALDRRRRWC
jgi:hypothetical protein